MIKRLIPSNNKEIPVIGIGTWKTFDVNNDGAKDGLKTVLETMYSAGGRLIDTSPMYGQSEQVTGDITSTMETRDDFFYATKVWTTGFRAGIQQMEASMKKMQRKHTDLMQVHNLTDWKIQLGQLHRMKETGMIRYAGITHYLDSSHEELERIIRSERPDFVQFNYSVVSRNAEKRLLNVAADVGVAVLINRPFAEGNIFKKIAGKPLPPWAAELDIDSWAAFFLKYIISHPAVTCVIPATGNPAHAADNAKAGTGKLPDATARKKMAEYIDAM